jgi:hypothetical protein
MKSAIQRSVVLLTFAALMGAYHVAAAQTPQSSQPQASQKAQAQEMAPVRGELLRVDTEAKTLAVKTSDGTEIQFAYTDQTEVTGAEKGVAGLATMSGVQVTVHYQKQEAGAKGPAYAATKIEVRPAK